MHEAGRIEGERRFPSGMSVTVLIPVFNDWSAADQLSNDLDVMFGKSGVSGDIVFVDDGSLESVPEHFPTTTPRHLKCVEVLELRKNVGHQRALCVGLVQLQRRQSENAVLVMDADGEDAPEEVPRLLEEFVKQGQGRVIFAQRGRRAEDAIFSVSYQLYRLIHRILVGFDIHVGNFSVLPATLIEPLIVSSDLWNHYAAAILKAKIPYGLVKVDRAKRIAGQSKMGFVGLVVHGLSAMSVFGDTVGTRLLVACAGMGVLALALIGVIIGIRLGTNLAIPGWATYTTGLLVLLLLQSLTLSFVFTFVILSGRGQSNFIPLRDCPVYVRREITVFERHD